MEIEAPTLTNEIKNLNELRFDNLDSDLNLNAETDSKSNEVVNSIRLLITAADDGTLLFEVDDLDITKITLKNGKFRLAAVQNATLESDFAKFKREVEMGRITRHTIRGGCD